jgi:hypothetical protein
MKDFDGFISDSPNGSDEKKNDPKKMNGNYAICKKLVNHNLENKRFGLMGYVLRPKNS